MPLIKSGSDSARQKNIETEIHSGKPIKQAVAIGYSVQRQSGHNDSHENRIAERHQHERRKYGQ